jgi:hypothetical protein
MGTACWRDNVPSGGPGKPSPHPNARRIRNLILAAIPLSLVGLLAAS